MVAYSFNPRFVPLIESGRKCQTIRQPRKRHAHPGEELQLYTGQRTRNCRLLGRAKCVSVHEIELFTYSFCLLSIELDGIPFDGDMNAFAIADGFTGLADMWGFWRKTHGFGEFRGVLVRWAPLSEERA